MRIVFSRKGFDSAAGGGPSPIVDGRPVSLPIPDSKGLSRTTYGDRGLGEMVEAATRGRIARDALCHDDPMFLADGTCIFGQCGGAQTHLDRQGVERGDVFLFFGWFRAADGEDHHRIFGYLRIGDIIRLDGAREEVLATYRTHRHPHAFGFHHNNRSDTLYVGEGRAATRASPSLRLTAPGHTRTVWAIPTWLRETGLSYHGDAKRWPAPDRLISAAQGQEFVADIGDRKDAREWLDGVIAAIEAKATENARSILNSVC